MSIRNSPCQCGSGQKTKKCCLAATSASYGSALDLRFAFYSRLSLHNEAARMGKSGYTLMNEHEYFEHEQGSIQHEISMLPEAERGAALKEAEEQRMELWRALWPTLTEERVRGQMVVGGQSYEG